MCRISASEPAGNGTNRRARSAGASAATGPLPSDPGAEEDRMPAAARAGESRDEATAIALCASWPPVRATSSAPLSGEPSDAGERRTPRHPSPRPRTVETRGAAVAARRGLSGRACDIESGVRDLNDRLGGVEPVRIGEAHHATDRGSPRVRPWLRPDLLPLGLDRKGRQDRVVWVWPRSSTSPPSPSSTSSSGVRVRYSAAGQRRVSRPTRAGGTSPDRVPRAAILGAGDRATEDGVAPRRHVLGRELPSAVWLEIGLAEDRGRAQFCLILAQRRARTRSRREASRVRAGSPRAHPTRTPYGEPRHPLAMNAVAGTSWRSSNGLANMEIIDISVVEGHDDGATVPAALAEASGQVA